MEINKIYNENCLDTMAKMPDNFIDLTVTSPPYDNLRTYNGYCFDFENVAKELYRVTKEQGVLVWVVADSVIVGSESGNSFRQALYFKEQGFNLHDTMIWYKPNAMPNVDKSRYCQSFEYMFVFSKGKPKTTNLRMIPTKNAGKIIKRKTLQTQNCNKAIREDKTNETRIDFNVYTLNVGGKKEAEHPAIFPEQLANDHIISWSNENDLIYDPFMGSGTTAKMAILNNRKYIGSEISKEYCEIIKTRIKECGGLFLNSLKTELSNEAGT
jgi:site-specific DNA-methyltransferase (adenine-specific)